MIFSCLLKELNNTKMRYFYFFFLFIISLFSCQKKEKEFEQKATSINDLQLKIEPRRCDLNGLWIIMDDQKYSELDF